LREQLFNRKREPVVMFEETCDESKIVKNKNYQTVIE
jgi:hypothetical protein